MSLIAQIPPLAVPGRMVLRVDDWKQIRLSLRLSTRELEITQHVFDDNKTESIARDLGISVHTVNTYLQRLYSKLDVRSRAQLVLRVFKTHLEYRAHPSDQAQIDIRPTSL